MMRRLVIFLLVSGILLGSVPSMSAEEDVAGKKPQSHGWIHKTLMYLPNRILDLFDTARFRLRVGPGFAVGARVTKLASAFVGSYFSLYAGLPGPRNRVLPKLPAGLESKNGAQVSVADLTVSGGLDPDYGPAECGFGAQLGFIGFDVGIDPLEILDLLAGVFFIDLTHDDL